MKRSSIYTLIFLASACVAKPPADPPASASGAPTAAPAPATTNAIDGTVSGHVVETMDVGTYTYVRVDVGGTSVWAAGPKTQVVVGDQVSFETTMPMRDYHSAKLDRTFELVYFVQTIRVAPAKAG